jgi:hypothetical protein
MKKFLLATAVAGLFLAACGSNEAPKEETKAPAEETNQEQSSNVKADLMKFYMSIPNTINATDADLNAYEGAIGDETADLAALKDPAVASAQATATAVEGIEVPESLADQKETLETALADLKTIYEEKAAAISADDTAKLEETNAKFEEVDASFNALLEEQGLIPSSIYNEVTK